MPKKWILRYAQYDELKYGLPRFGVAESFNDERVEKFYFLQKQKFGLFFLLDSCKARITIEVNGGSALRRFYAKQAK